MTTGDAYIKLKLMTLRGLEHLLLGCRESHDVFSSIHGDNSLLDLPKSLASLALVCHSVGSLLVEADDQPSPGFGAP